MRIAEFAWKTSSTAVATLAVITALSSTESAQAAGRPRVQRAAAPAPAKPAFTKPVIAVVSVKDQRVTLYDADGGALRSRVSSGQTGLETPAGVYAVLQKNRDHYSNIYDGASMPFMQRITWSGIALHAGVLPGYPASHGCVRMAYQFANQIFPLTRLGMRVVISPDDFAPVPISHALLPQPAPPGAAIATNASFQADADAEQANNPFQPDVGKWPARRAQLDALRGLAATKAIEADAATAKSTELKKVFDKRSLEQVKAQKLLRAATLNKRAADAQLARADLALWTANLPRQTKNEQESKSKAIAATHNATDAIPAATDKVAAADRELAAAKQALDSEPEKSAEWRVLKKEFDKKKSVRVAAGKALAAALAAKRAANDRLAAVEKALYIARIPRPTKNEEIAKAKALAVTSDAGTKATAAAAAAQGADDQFAGASREFNAAEARRVAAVDASQRAMRATLPVSIFVSLKSQHVYVRQGHDPVVDMPVAIADPKQPIGTHVYTAVDYAGEGASLRWTAVTLGRNGALGNAPRNRWANLDVAAPATDVRGASAALDRVKLPAELTQRLAGYVWPGSSVIVSDEEMSSKETGKATDFVVLLSGEPQGGLRSRKGSAPSSSYRRRYRDYDDDDYRPRKKASSTFFFW